MKFKASKFLITNRIVSEHRMFTFPTSVGPGSRHTEHGRLSGNWEKIQAFSQITTLQVKVCICQHSYCNKSDPDAFSPRRRRDMRCLRVCAGSSPVLWCERCVPCPAEEDRPVESTGRYPCETLCPSRPYHPDRTGTYRTAWRRLEQTNTGFNSSTQLWSAAPHCHLSVNLSHLSSLSPARGRSAQLHLTHKRERPSEKSVTLMQ